MTNYAGRLKKIEERTKTVDAHILVLIREGAFYDEITDEERDAYCVYRGCNRRAMEDIQNAVNLSLHFQLERKPKPPTREELAERIEEVQKAVADE